MTASVAERFVIAQHERLQAEMKDIEARPGGTTDAARVPQLSRLAVTGTLLMEDLTNVNLPVLLCNILSGQTMPPTHRSILLPVWLDQARKMLGRWVDEHGIYVEPADLRINELVSEFDSDVGTVEAGVEILKNWSGTPERLWEVFGQAVGWDRAKTTRFSRRAKEVGVV